MRRHEKASFHYLQWQDIYQHEKPFEILADIPESSPDKRATNVVLRQEGPELIRDVRGDETKYELDKHGFAFRNMFSDFTEFDKRLDVENDFLPNHVKQWLSDNIEGADRVEFFDWHLRRNVREEAPARLDINDGTHALLPVNYAHIDQSPLSAINRVRVQFGDEAEELLRGRVRIVNFWRPLWRPIVDAPLALCDGSKVKENDVVYVDHVRQYYIGETAYLLPREENQWYYLSDQKPEEVTLLKIFDSDADVEARWCPHASFTHSEIGIGAAPRESIEVRAFIFTLPRTDSDKK